MGVDESRSEVMKAIANGACQYWIKPLIENQIKNMWQFVAKKVLHENKHDQVLGIFKVNGQSKRGRDDNNGPKETNDCLVEKDNNDNDNYQPLTKKNPLWSSELHGQFLRVVNKLGIDSTILFPIIFISFSYLLCLYTSKTKFVFIFFSLPYFSEAKPKAILKEMNARGLTRPQVASHLQVCFLYQLG